MSIFIFRKSGVLCFHINSKLESGVKIDSLLCYCLLNIYIYIFSITCRLLRQFPNNMLPSTDCFHVAH